MKPWLIFGAGGKGVGALTLETCAGGTASGGCGGA